MAPLVETDSTSDLRYHNGLDRIDHAGRDRAWHVVDVASIVSFVAHLHQRCTFTRALDSTCFTRLVVLAVTSVAFRTPDSESSDEIRLDLKPGTIASRKQDYSFPQSSVPILTFYIPPIIKLLNLLYLSAGHSFDHLAHPTH